MKQPRPGVRGRGFVRMSRDSSGCVGSLDPAREDHLEGAAQSANETAGGGSPRTEIATTPAGPGPGVGWDDADICAIQVEELTTRPAPLSEGKRRFVYGVDGACQPVLARLREGG
jgi:hypothetical protein